MMTRHPKRILLCLLGQSLGLFLLLLDLILCSFQCRLNLLGIISVVVEVINEPVIGNLAYRLVENHNIYSIVLFEEIDFKIERVKSLSSPVTRRISV